MGRPKKSAMPTPEQIANYTPPPVWERKTYKIGNGRIDLSGRNQVDFSINMDQCSVFFENESNCLFAQKPGYERKTYFERADALIKCILSNKDEIRLRAKEADKSFDKLQKDIADYNTNKASSKVEFNIDPEMKKAKIRLTVKLDAKKSESLKKLGKKSSLVRR